LGIGQTTLGNYVNGHRKPGERVAQRISDDLGGRLSVAEIRGWTWPRPPRCRFFPTDPMPLARALGDEPYRDRASDRGAVRYLREVRPDLPPAVAAAAELVITHLEVTEPDEETAR